ncbi:serine/threonine-protein kinase [Tahibacter soli]|uniref:Serine/threonine-protein kinase n=1 Tax=Tahibacter soli TaxID=2983605 RepID=A0A9X3YGQ1_9GAMM|nr:serine/threonine-protein kinase [Tahibacter soli]MDC8011964.1 serine/threonine-protein kinase [Tahibacter soli]
MPVENMTPQRFGELRTQFHALMELAPERRAERLAAIGEHDAGLRAALERLLANLHAPDLDPPQPSGSHDALPASRIIGAFRLVERIGRGGMGEVYLAERVDGGFEQRVALKLVRGGALSRDLARRFARERQLLARLAHPNIARLIDGGVTGDARPWLAMEYVDGRSIARYATDEALDLARRVALVRRVCAAVAFAHGHLVVHRDIKPANILVGADGEPKLLDFGIAKLVDDDVEATRTVLPALTVRYAAPEQIAGDRTTTATDVYALGVLLFELAAGRSPYARAQAGDSDWTQAVIGEAPTRLSDALAPGPDRRRARGDLDRIVEKALAKAPGERYAGAAAFGDDLDDWLAGRALRSGIGGTRALTRQMLRRWRWPLALVGATVLALGVGAVVAIGQARRAQEQAAIAQANLDAMLGVLSAANPHKFAGREPNASEFLKTAAATLEAEYAQQPALIGNALGEIGHGLINLGRARDAEPVLVAAVAAIERDPGASAARKLGTYKLLVFSQDYADAAPRALATARRIEALAGEPDADPSHALDALGSAAGVLSKRGYFDEAAHLFARGDALAFRGLSAAARENYWRQRAWVALRAADSTAASDAIARSLSAQGEDAADFTALRRAEAHALAAEIALAAGDEKRAGESLALAAPALLDEYPAGHAQRAAFDVLRARYRLQNGDAAGASELAQSAVAALGDADDAAKDRLQARCTIARSHAALGACDASRAALALAKAERDALQPLLPRERAAFDAASAAVEKNCAR